MVVVGSLVLEGMQFFDEWEKEKAEEERNKSYSAKSLSLFTAFIEEYAHYKSSEGPFGYLPPIEESAWKVIKRLLFLPSKVCSSDKLDTLFSRIHNISKALLSLEAGKKRESLINKWRELLLSSNNVVVTRQEPYPYTVNMSSVIRRLDNQAANITVRCVDDLLEKTSVENVDEIIKLHSNVRGFPIHSLYFSEMMAYNESLCVTAVEGSDEKLVACLYGTLMKTNKGQEFFFVWKLITQLENCGEELAFQLLEVLKSYLTEKKSVSFVAFESDIKKPLPHRLQDQFVIYNVGMVVSSYNLLVYQIADFRQEKDSDTPSVAEIIEAKKSWLRENVSECLELLQGVNQKMATAISYLG